MKSFYFTVFVVLFSSACINLNAQVIQSDCNAPDSVVQSYERRALGMALENIHNQELTYQDSVIIPQEHADVFRQALVTMHNATGLAALDTVRALNINYGGPFRQILMIVADSTLPWVINMRNEISPVGEPYLDSLSAIYPFSPFTSSTYSFTSSAYMRLSSPDVYNVEALAALVALHPEVENASATTQYFLSSYPSSGIVPIMYADYIELDYWRGWMCEVGCAFSRHWTFRIYPDCTVEFVESYGDTLDWSFINNISPTAAFTAEVDCETVQFNDESFMAFSHVWDFGDGNTSNEASPSHTYAAPGEYLVLKMATATGITDTAEKVITVLPSGLESIEVTGMPEATEAVDFTIVSTGVETWNWDFGDGNTEITAVANASHIYAQAGSYVVTVTTNDSVCSATALINIEVSEAMGLPLSAKSELLNIFPNPSIGTFQVQYSPGLSEGSMQIFDIAGREIPFAATTQGPGGMHVEIHAVSGGIYLLRVVLHKGEVITKRFIVE